MAHFTTPALRRIAALEAERGSSTRYAGASHTSAPTDPIRAELKANMRCARLEQAGIAEDAARHHMQRG